jgi:serine/threonine protein kinase
MSDLIGQTIGRYRIIEQLGVGGMAIVYKAIDIRLDRSVALKVIRAENLAEAQFVERFEREAKALARLNHPNIVHINDFGELNGLPYLEMDYISGGTLDKLLGAMIPWSEAARFLAPVAYALDYAHQQGVVHRDVKPSNILITQAGDPMITDFGIAKIMEMDRSTLVTLPGFGVGTPEYMSPEQVMGKTIDGRSDIYSLGIVLYEMYTGHPPYRADTAMAVAVKQVHDPIPRPRHDLLPLPGPAETAVMTALAKKPDERYPNMAVFAETLEKLGKKAPPAPSKATFTAIPIPKGLELTEEEGEVKVKPTTRNKMRLFFLQNKALTAVLAFVLVVVFSSLIFGIGYAQKKRAEQQLLMQTSSALSAPLGQETPLPVMLNIATGTDTGETQPSETIPVLLVMDGTPSATPSPTPTLRLGPNQTGQPTTHGGNPTAWPTTGPGTPTVQIPTSEPPTSEPPTTVPPTAVPPTSEPATPVPTEVVPTDPPAATNTPHEVPTRKPTKTPK